MSCEISSRIKTCFQLLGYKHELRQAALPTFEDVVKPCLFVQHNTKQERGDQQPSID